MAARAARRRPVKDAGDFVGDGRYDGTGGPPRAPRRKPAKRRTLSSVRRLPLEKQVECWELAGDPLATACARVAMLDLHVWPEHFHARHDLHACDARDIAAALLWMLSPLTEAEVTEALGGGSARRGLARLRKFDERRAAIGLSTLADLLLAVDGRVEGMLLWLG